MRVKTGQETRPAPTAPLNTRPLGHVPALDGIRALAVAAVVLFHGEIPGTTGGFLGVSVFFTLSGFLITSLLLREWASAPDQGVDLRRFFSRRFRRLLPASWFTIATVLVMGIVGVWETEQLRMLRSDVPWTLAELVNWHFIAQGTSYGAAQSAPSPLEHFWSLAIEEQFYFLLPVLLSAVLVRTRARVPQRRLRTLVVVFGALAALSALANGLSARSSIDRAYFGTDTRAAELLVGALLACALLRWNGPTDPTDATNTTRGERPSMGALGAQVGGVAGLVVLTVFVHVADLRSEWLYPWGLLATAVSTCAVIVAALHRSACAWVLTLAPFVLLGRISYGVYLLHWPVFLWLNEARTGLDGAALFLVRVVVSLAAATAMYRVIEMPVRSGRRLSTRAAYVAVPGAAVLLLAAAFWTTRDLPAPPRHLEERDPGTVAVREAPAASTTLAPTTAPTTTPTTAVPTAQIPSEQVPPPTAAPPPTAPPRRATRVLLIGDSVAASLEDALGDALIARGVSFATAAAPGCGLITGDPADDDGTPLDFTTACNAAIPGNQRGAVEKFGPDLVIGLSSWEAVDRIVDGRFLPLGAPETDAVMLRLYDEAVERLTASGAAIALTSMPEPVATRTRTADADSARRLAHLNTLLPKVATANPGRVTILPFDAVVCPTTPCPTVVDGVELRPVDGNHFDDPAGARLVAERVADLVVALDLNALP